MEENFKLKNSIYFEQYANILKKQLDECKVFRLSIECFNRINAELLELINDYDNKCDPEIKFKIGKDFTTDDFQDLRNFLDKDEMKIFKNKKFRIKF